MYIEFPLIDAIEFRPESINQINGIACTVDGIACIAIIPREREGQTAS